jgi:DNA-binding transcriptional LysR family regulator
MASPSCTASAGPGLDFDMEISKITSKAAYVSLRDIGMAARSQTCENSVKRGRRTMVYRLSDIDIRLLHVFRAVVECRGFSNAQAVLNVSQPTISGHIGELEKRLGIRLCERGRRGFRLTNKGERVYVETVQLFKAHEHFQNVTQELKGRLSGFLNIGVIDNVVTDPVCPVIPAVRRMNARSDEVVIRLDIMPPSELERAVMEMSVDLAIGTFDRQLPGLDYRKIYAEENTLMCAASHPIAALQEPEQVRAAVRRARKVTRTYLEGRDISPMGGDDSQSHGYVQTLEAAAILILGGGHLGFLPRHYAQRWVEEGSMVPILPEEFRYTSDFFIVTPATPRRSTIVQTFLADVGDALRAGSAQARTVKRRA